MKEFLIHPRPNLFRDAMRTHPQTAVLDVLRTQAGRPKGDFDVLFGTGQLARLAHAPDPQRPMLEWLRAGDAAPRRWDVAACFLMGFWAPPIIPDEALVSALAARLNASPQRAEGWNELVRALFNALVNSSSPAIIQAIKPAFQTALKHNAHLDLPPQVVTALSYRF